MPGADAPLSPYPPPGPLPWQARVLAVLAVVGVVLGIALVVALALDAPAIGTVDDDTLARSVSDEISVTAFPGLPRCRGAGDAWTCEVAGIDSGSATYDVRRHGRRCWSARLQDRSPGMPRAASGCASLRHQLDLDF